MVAASPSPTLLRKREREQNGTLSRARGEGQGGGIAARTLLGFICPSSSPSPGRPSAAPGWSGPISCRRPAPSASRSGGLGANGDLWTHLAATSIRMGWGFLLGAAAGTLAGALTGASPLARALVDPTVQGLRSVPSIAWVPLFILWLGIFEGSKIALIAVGVFFPGLSQPHDRHRPGRPQADRGRQGCTGWGASSWCGGCCCRPALPSYVTGLRSGLGLGWMFVVAAELMGASEGLGFLLIDGQQTGRPAVVIAAILLFAVLGKTTDLALAWLGSHLLAWQDTVGGTA